MDCSRLNVWRRVEIHDLYMSNISKFQLVYEEDNYIFSHAGLYKDWMDKYEIDLDQLKNFTEFFINRKSSLEDVSMYRGGWCNVGSCVWADINESVRHELYSNKRQIVGHTQLAKKPYITTKIACLDVRQCFMLNTETDEINELS